MGAGQTAAFATLDSAFFSLEFARRPLKQCSFSIKRIIIILCGEAAGCWWWLARSSKRCSSGCWLLVTIEKPFQDELARNVITRRRRRRRCC